MSGAFGDVRLFPQAEEPDVQLRVFGDEFYARYETLAGYTCVYDATLGRYCYASLDSGVFVSTGVPIDTAAPPGVEPHLKERPFSRNERFDERFDELQKPSPGVVENLEPFEVYGPNEGLLYGRAFHRGAVHGLAIMVDFKDVQTSITPGEVDAMLNGENYTANGNHCSVREYFLKMSGGKLTFTNEVIGPVRLSHKRSYYVDTLLAKEALDLATQQIPDLKPFDSQGKYVIDALSFLYAGPVVMKGELWPHNANIDWRAGPYAAGRYQITALGADASELVIGTYCHEAGHMLCRFPDLYDYGKYDGDFEAGAGLGHYCLMSAGNQLDGGRTPAPVCGYLRNLAGWCTRIPLVDGGQYTAQHGAYDTIHIFETRFPNEYFMVENRSRLGLDAHAPADGLAVYHCDIEGSNERGEATFEKHYQCALLQADRRRDLEENNNRGDPADLFALVQGEALSDTTTPSLKLWSGAPSGLALAEISGPGELISFAVRVSKPATAADPASAPAAVAPPAAATTGVVAAAAAAPVGGPVPIPEPESGPGPEPAPEGGFEPWPAAAPASRGAAEPDSNKVADLPATSTANRSANMNANTVTTPAADGEVLKRLLEEKDVLQARLDLLKLAQQMDQAQRQADVDRVKSAADLQQAEADRLKALFPGGSAKPVAGETKYDEKFGYIAQLAVQQAVAAAGQAIAAKVAAAVGKQTLRLALVDSPDVCADDMASLQIAQRVQQFRQELQSQAAANATVMTGPSLPQATAKDAFESYESTTPGAGAAGSVIAAIGAIGGVIGGALPGIGQALTVAPAILSSLADIAGYFQVQDTFKTLDVAASQRSLQACVVEALKATAGFNPAIVFPDFRPLAGLAASPLLTAYNACLAARRVLADGLATLNVIRAAAAPEDAANPRLIAVQAAQVRSESLLKAFDEFDKLVSTVPEGRTHSLLAAAAVREYLRGPNKTPVYPLHVALMSTGAELSDRKWLWWPWSLVFLGGCTASYALADQDGHLLAAGTVRKLVQVKYKRGQGKGLKFDDLTKVGGG